MAERLPPSEGREDSGEGTSGLSGQREDGPKPKKASLKRTSANPKNAKAKKHKKARVSQPEPLGYTVHQGEDMLLVISNSTSQYVGPVWTSPKKIIKRKKPTKGKVKVIQKRKKKKTVRAPRRESNPLPREEEEPALFVPQKATDNRWGQNLPEEVLINIFQMIVAQDGAVPFLCRVGRVCRLWNAAASSPTLWRKATVCHCWSAPAQKQTAATVRKIKDTLNWLTQNRFSQLREFSLHSWKNNTTYAVEVVAQSCPHLRSLRLSYCAGLAGQAFHSLGLHSRSLQSIDLQFSEFQVEGLLEYLENYGRQIKQILFTHGMKNNRLLAAITRGFCPDLELLEVNTALNSKNSEVPLYIQALQAACPRLKTFRMLNVIPLHKTMRHGPTSPLGFPLLEELCIATASHSYLTNKDLSDILFASTGLRVLDLRGCTRVTASGIASLPCEEVECFFWGQYYRTTFGGSPPEPGIHILTQKWSRTLQQLDIGNQLFTEEDLEMAMSHLGQAPETDTLRSLNLSGTRITAPALRSAIGQATALSYLNLSSCRNLPRGHKRVYRGREDVRQLQNMLD